jgi:hypothetical protein
LDVIRFRIDNPVFLGNSANAIYANTTGQSHANQWVITNPVVNGTGGSSFLFFNASDIDIYGGDFEGNNTSNISGNSTIQMQGNPIDGRKGLSVFGGYYEVDGGDAEFAFIQLPGDPGGVHSIHGVEMGRISNTIYTTNEVRLVNDSNAAGVTNLDLRGNSFWSVSPYVQSAARPDIGISHPAVNNYKITGYDSNFFMPGYDAPSNLCAPGSRCMNLPDGHIEQWGAVTSNTSGPGYGVSVTWPTPCPNAVDSIEVSALNSGTPYAVGVGISGNANATLYSALPGTAINWRMLCH